MTDCQHCHKPMKPASANMLCQNCRTDYWTMIHQLGHVQLPALRSIMLKQAHIGTTGHTPNRGSAPLPIDTHAQNLIAESEAWLDEQAGKINATYANLPWDKAWKRIIANKHTILNMSTAADDYAALEHIVRRNEQALTPEEAMVIIGTCPKCGHQATSTPQAETWICPDCKWQGGVQASKPDATTNSGNSNTPENQSKSHATSPKWTSTAPATRSANGSPEANCTPRRQNTKESTCSTSEK